MFSAACIVISSRETDDLTVRSRRSSSRLFGRASRMWAKDFLSAGPAAMTGSQPSDTVVPLLQKTCTTTTTTSRSTNTLTHSVFPCRDYWKMTVMIYVASQISPQAERAVSSFPPSVTSVGKMNCDQTSRDVMSTLMLLHLHLHRDNSVQMDEVWDLQHNSPPGLEQHFHNTWDSLTSFTAQVADWELQFTENHLHQKHLLENTL